MASRKYQATGPEAETQPGSRGRVLRNLPGITSVREMDATEARALQVAMDRFVRRFDARHRFTAADIRGMHLTWLSGIYGWAGEYRSVNMSKDGFPFATAGLIPDLMLKFQRRVLSSCTPCGFKQRVDVVEALGWAHVELVLIHPFRDGNGRIARAFSTLMALQAGLPLLDLSPIAGKRRAEYFAAIQAGMDRNYSPMAEIFEELIERSLAGP